MIYCGNNLKNINNNFLESVIEIKKEGLLFLIDYIKGDENFVFIEVNGVKNSNEYGITETLNNRIIKWKRRLSVGNLVYGIKLPMIFDKIRIYFKSDKDVFNNLSSINFDIEYNFWD